MGERLKNYTTPFRRYAPSVFLGALTLGGGYVISLYHYALSHSLAVLFTIVIAWGIFVVIRNSRRFIDNSYLLYSGIVYPFVAFIDLIHILAYKGIIIFSVVSAIEY